MKKILYGLLSLIFLFTLTGCQDKFDPQTALNESRITLTDFTELYVNDEKVIDKYNKEELSNFFTEKHQDYFSETFRDNVLVNKLDSLKFDNQDDFDYVNIRKELLFFTINENEDGVFWNETNITEDDVNAEKETVTFYLRSTTKTRPNRYVEMVKEDGQWKINNILNL